VPQTGHRVGPQIGPYRPQIWPHADTIVPQTGPRLAFGHAAMPTPTPACEERSLLPIILTTVSSVEPQSRLRYGIWRLAHAAPNETCAGWVNGTRKGNQQRHRLGRPTGSQCGRQLIACLYLRTPRCAALSQPPFNARSSAYCWRVHLYGVFIYYLGASVSCRRTFIKIAGRFGILTVRLRLYRVTARRGRVMRDVIRNWKVGPFTTAT
jgi:hypothetical protein